MNWEAIGAVGELAGGLVVIASLLYLAQQVRIGRKQQRVDAFERLIHMSSDIRRDVTNNPQLAMVISKAIQGESLDHAEMLQLQLHVEKWPNLIHAAYQYWRSGAIDDPEWVVLSEPFSRDLENHRNGKGNLRDKIMFEMMQSMPTDVQTYFRINSESTDGT